MSKQNYDPALWPITDPYIGLAQFWTYLMIDFKKKEKYLHLDTENWTLCQNKMLILLCVKLLILI